MQYLLLLNHELIAIAFRLSQKLKTRVIKKNSTNPEWNEELTLSIEDSAVPIRRMSILYDMVISYANATTNSTPEVFDKDTFIDDSMGNAELDILRLEEIVKKLQDAVDKYCGKETGAKQTSTA
ncbi:hypothetical protein PR202_gb07022 [Eleusine coracana subsp. coracana]|uniref:C2 domain-containing protein n=1 Tax=Eleusine coracana subsp. coracana TaxID=191504 RepID=A0AAV5EAX2_ELECO|nr:hypothetical protein PR202_gb07022 [Eleusine coracana subsp. coracana]